MWWKFEFGGGLSNFSCPHHLPDTACSLEKRQSQRAEFPQQKWDLWIQPWKQWKPTTITQALSLLIFSVIQSLSWSHESSPLHSSQHPEDSYRRVYMSAQ